MRFFLSTLPRTFLKIYSGKNLLWHALAIILTAAILYSGLDWLYFRSVERLYWFFFPAVIIGAFLPVLLPLALFVYGKLGFDRRAVTTAWMLAQAALLGSAASSIYKMFTGRIQPDLQNYAIDISHSFHFGFLRHGIFWGWPSSHTTIAFAMAVALVTLYPKRTWLVWCALLYAFYIGVGVSMSIHWLSDVVAGAILGSVIGRVVGAYYVRSNIVET